METADISLVRMGILYLFLLLPVALMLQLKVPLVQRLLIAAGRMTVQLVLVGLYLRYLFEWNSAMINVLWLAAMTLVAAGHILRSAHLKLRELLPFVFLAVVTSGKIRTMQPS